jgi:PAS domain S-box-containing protein
MAIDDGARAIVRAVIDLANDLDLRVVAEGVEDRVTWEALAALGCDVAQGYHFSPPLPAAGLTEWAGKLRDWRVEETERTRFETSLAEHAGERGTRLAAEQEFVARTRAEWALRIRDRALAASSTGVMITEATYPTFAVVYVNPAFCKLSGYTAEEVLGNSPGLLQGPGTDPDAVNTMLAALSAGEEHTVRLLNYRKDGSPFWNELALSPVRDEVGQITHWVSIHNDATARVGAEQQRETLAQSEKLRALGQMASGVAHDLNQALTLIVSHCELGHQALRKTSLDRDELHELFTVVSQAALDGGETVKRLLLFSRKPIAMQAETVDLEALVREVVDLTAPRWRDTTQAEGRPVSLYVEVIGHPAVSGSRSQLRDALINLVFNAVDALPSGGTIRMIVRGDADQDQALLEIIDTGTGMTPEVRKRIFEPFFTTKGQHGTGLGLAMAFGVAEGLGGTIEVESAPGQGTTIRMRLPASTIGQSTTGAPTDSPARIASGGGRLRILAVDDEPGITRSLIRLLRPYGHAVTTATSGEEALDKLTSESFDVVLSDLGLGAGMNGWELAERVRTCWPEARFVLATGWGASIDQAEATERGVDAVLAKPYRPEELFSVLGARQAA